MEKLRCFGVVFMVMLIIGGCSGGETRNGSEPFFVVGDQAAVTPPIEREIESDSNQNEGQGTPPIFSPEVSFETDLDGKELHRSRAIRLHPDLELRLEKAEQLKPVVGLFESSLDVVEESGQVALHFSLRNSSENAVDVVFGSGQLYDFFVYDERGDEVFRWSHDKAFTMALVNRTIGAGEQLSFLETWDLTDHDGNGVGSGTYEIKVMFMCRLNDRKLVDGSELTAAAAITVPGVTE